MLEPMTVLPVSETHLSFKLRIMPLLQTAGNAIDLRLFKKKESKKNRQQFWDQNRNRKYSIVLKQSISKPALGIVGKYSI